MGPVPPADSDATPVGSNNGLAMHVDGGGPTNRWQQHLAPQGEFVNQPAPTVAGQFVARVVLEAAENVGTKAAHTVEKMTENNAGNIGTSSVHVNPMLNLV